nr:MAG TPA: hypothetical protein [Bacteriophage sp.]
MVRVKMFFLSMILVLRKIRRRNYLRLVMMVMSLLAVIFLYLQLRYVIALLLAMKRVQLFLNPLRMEPQFIHLTILPPFLEQDGT